MMCHLYGMAVRGEILYNYLKEYSFVYPPSGVVWDSVIVSKWWSRQKDNHETREYPTHYMRLHEFYTQAIQVHL